MDKPKYFTIYGQMTKSELRTKAMELLEVAEALLEYIDALPEEVVASLPAMPGIDRDFVERVLEI